MTLRGLLLGSAAIFTGAGAAVAADLPLVEPVEYVRICDAFGMGYFYIPGTDTCLKVAGYVRAETHWVDGDTDILLPGGTKSEFNNWTSRARGNVQIQSQTMTEIGLVHAYVELQMTVGPSDYDLDYSAANPELPGAFIEISNDFGTFTGGMTGSFFDFFGSYEYGPRIAIDDSTTEQMLFAYTVNGPSGLRGTLSVEDPKSSGRRFNGADDYEGQELPDLVGNVRLDQEWGAAQIMGVVRQIHDVDGDGVGWAASGGITINLPVGGLEFSTQVGYADGAIAYITNDPGGVGDFAGPTGDDTNQAWMARAGVTAPFGETVAAWIDGSYTHAEDEVNDDSYDFWAFVVGAAWTPNDRISMGPEIGYNKLDGDDAGEDGELWGVMWRVESSF